MQLTGEWRSQLAAWHKTLTTTLPKDRKETEQQANTMGSISPYNLDPAQYKFPSPLEGWEDRVPLLEYTVHPDTPSTITY